MMDLLNSRFSPSLPFKSVAAALLLSVLLGPIGLLYSSLWGGLILICLTIMFISHKFILPVIFIWIVSCIWGAASVEQYNKKLLKLFVK